MKPKKRKTIVGIERIPQVKPGILLDISRKQAESLNELLAVWMDSDEVHDGKNEVSFHDIQSIEEQLFNELHKDDEPYEGN
jgi:hypothetical protein